jgi:predicted nucleotidyltransferase
MELQADCFAGVWGANVNRSGDQLDAGDLEEGLRAAQAIGDDTLQRSAGLSMSTVHLEQQRLEKHGLVERTESAGRVRYSARDDGARWKVLRQLIRDIPDPAEVVEEVLAGVQGIEAAFVYGSFARGDARDDSDVDVLVMGDADTEAQVGRAAAEASMLLGRPVEVRAYTRERLERQLSAA